VADKAHTEDDTRHPLAHKRRHEELHACLDELVTDYIRQHPGAYISSTTCMELLQWSFEQTENPTEDPQ